MRVGEGLLALGKIALVFVIGFPLFMYLAQDSLIFHPQPLAKRAAPPSRAARGREPVHRRPPTARGCMHGTQG